MRLPDSFIQELIDKNDIESVVSRYVPTLKRRGRNLVGLCPFHGEKTPSFNLYPENSSFYCFGCGAGGDVITFIKRIENLSYMDAVRFLADRVGMRMPEESRENDAVSRLRTRVLEANREVDDYFKVMMKVEGGPVLTVEVGSYAFRALPRWYCIGDNGTLQIDDFTAEKGGITRPRFGAEGNVAPVVVQTPAGPTRMMAPRPPETREELELPKSDADWTSLYKNLLDVIDNGAELIVKPEQVRRVLQLIETIFESAKTGHSVACRI